MTITTSGGTGGINITGVSDTSKYALDQTSGFIQLPIDQSLVRKTQGSTWVWKHPSTTQVLASSWWIYIPIGGVYYTTFGIGLWGHSTGYVNSLGRMGIGVIGNYTHHTSSTKVGTWTTSSLDYAPAGSVSYSSTAGDTITYSCFGSIIILRSIATVNGGFAIVGVDGDYTVANRLPKFTQSDYSAGICRASDVGKCYIDTGCVGVLPDNHTPIAEGLLDGAHTITFEVTGTHGTYSSGSRAYIGGIVASSSSNIGQSLSTNSVVIGILEIVQDEGYNGSSAMCYVPEPEKALSVGSYEFLGEVHGGETLVSEGLFLDSIDISGTSPGSYTAGSVFLYKRLSTLANSDASTTPICKKDMAFTFSAYNPIQCLCSWKVYWLSDKRVRSQYPAMLPIGQAKQSSAGMVQFRWDNAQIGSYSSLPTDFSSNNNVNHGNTQALAGVLSSSLHPTKAYVCNLDGGLGLNWFSQSAPDSVFLRDMSTGEDKIYFCRSVQNNIESFLSGDIIHGAIGFGMAR